MARRLKLQVHISLDGFVAGPNGELDWIFTGAGQQPVIDRADSCDTLLIGRKMAQGFIDHWEHILEDGPQGKEHPLAQRMVAIRKIVFSRSSTSVNGRNTEMAKGDTKSCILSLKEEAGKDILVYGGAEFVKSLIDDDLIDEYHLFQIPVALGNGLRIFSGEKKFTLTKSVIQGNRITINTYEPLR